MSSRQCTTEGCLRLVGPKGAKGFCPLHYKRFLVHGSPLAHIVKMVSHIKKVCRVCGKPQHAHLLCSKHLQRWESRGTTDAWAPTLAERFWPKVERSEGCWEWKASRHPAGHGYLMDDAGKITYAHRISWQLHYGPIPEGLQVNHDCNNANCVRPDHLYVGTQLDNMHDAIRAGAIPHLRKVAVSDQRRLF